ncbi:MAG TPA: hypothetical protein VMB71_06000 [Acetobacteraceae bacterium]|nr:hypothetical protein [Acetobacteraceae bacterium]
MTTAGSKAEERTSFLKKRSKKLLPFKMRVWSPGTPPPIDKSFLVLFFKKEHAFLADFS